MPTMQRSALPTLDACALHDGRAGNARQALALAHALDGRPSEIVLTPRGPWRWLAPRRLPGADSAYGADFRSICQAPPLLAIGCGLVLFEPLMSE